jgi:hypothetical protein
MMGKIMVCYPPCTNPAYYVPQYVTQVFSTSANMALFDTGAQYAWTNDAHNLGTAATYVDSRTVLLKPAGSSGFMTAYANFVSACTVEQLIYGKSESATTAVNNSIQQYITDPSGFLSDLKNWATTISDVVTSIENGFGVDAGDTAEP